MTHMCVWFLFRFLSDGTPLAAADEIAKKWMVRRRRVRLLLLLARRECMSMGCRHSWTSGEKSVFLRGPRQVPVFAATAASAAAGAAPTMTLMPDKAQTVTLKGAAAGGDAATAAAGLWVKLNAGQPCPLRVKCVPGQRRRACARRDGYSRSFSSHLLTRRVISTAVVVLRSRILLT